MSTMDQAWLDSLSEDWISQPRSASSPHVSASSLTCSLHGAESQGNAPAGRIPEHTSRIPRRLLHENCHSPLSERSPNEANVPLSQRGVTTQSKLRTELAADTRGRHISRTLSASTVQSSRCPTIQHKSLSLSPKKGAPNTPEWKLRLLGGDVGYGEQRDLFSAAGLEAMFKQPPSEHIPLKNVSLPITDEGSSMMPSSPPPYGLHASRHAGTDESIPKSENWGQNTQTAPIKYRLVDEAASGFSTNDLSQSSNFRPQRSLSLGQEQHFSPRVSKSSTPSSIVNEGQKTGRHISGQSVIRNEELSPIYISRHNTSDGKVDYAALDVSPMELKQRLERFAQNNAGEESRNHGEDSPQLLEDQEEGGALDSRFVNLRRGGYSQEGSFRKRMLSSSSLPAVDESMVLPESSIQASTPKQLPMIRKTRASHEYHDASPRSPSQPRPPYPSPTKVGVDRKQNNGSPLKLFGDYDTFTNQKLLRRLSQFEEKLEEADPDMARDFKVDSEQADANICLIPTLSRVKDSASHALPTSRRMSNFGKGDLDSYRFSEGLSHDSSGPDSQDDYEGNPPLHELNAQSQTSFSFKLGPSSHFEERNIQRTTRYTNKTETTAHTINVHKTTRPAKGASDVRDQNPTSTPNEQVTTPKKAYGAFEVKRLPKSPLKDPTPKRRRTLRATETAEISSSYAGGSNDLNQDHLQAQSLGKKRKDARHGEEQQAANPRILATRQMLRPRTPTPSQRSSQQRQNVPSVTMDNGAIERSIAFQEENIASIQAKANATHPFHSSIARNQMQSETRKGSVTTQDYLDEAKRIMTCIRGKKGGSGLPSAGKSEAELGPDAISNGDAANTEQEDSYQESTKEPFSRPPSREGAPVPRAAPMQQDPKLLDHLRKYEEKGDLDDIITSSMKSLALAKDAVESAKELDRITAATVNQAVARSTEPNDFIESDPPNIRISQNPDMLRKRKLSTSTVPTMDGGHVVVDFPSNGSSNQSTSRSIPTGSSRGSDSRQIIAPHTVSHLIPEQLAGMVLDRERRLWVKRKSPSGEQKGKETSVMDNTEEDPFGDIPDLSVDETQELIRMRAAAVRHEDESRLRRDGQTLEGQDDPYAGIQTVDAEGFSTSSPFQAQTGTRPLTDESTCEEMSEEVDQEITILDDRIKAVSPKKPRNVTITFSSPIASIIQTSDFLDEDSSECHTSQGSQRSIFVKHRERKSKRRHSSGLMRTRSKSAGHTLPFGSQRFPTRPVSRIDEKDEEPDADDERGRRSLSLMVSEVPQISPRHACSMVLATPRASQEVGKLELSPLSSFTMHQSDESFDLEVSYLGGNQCQVSKRRSKRTLSLSIKDLVEKLTEVEPFEPYWEDLKCIKLKEKRLANLHKLDEFCGHLEELDVSNNQINQLEGVPPSIRHLRIGHNCISDLAAWGHLSNLQYVDVSDNELESLSAFSHLVHLRGLRADNNKISSIAGILHLNALRSLRLRGNRVDSLEFEGSKLHELTELDLRDNAIFDVRNLQALSALSAINLENNGIEDFSNAASGPVSSLKSLKISGNDLRQLDLSHFPDLRLLYVDRNRLGTITGLLKTKHLDSLSMREQKAGATLNMSFLREAFEVRKLFLSGNYLGKFEVHTPFLNLQYLELASCGIESLPTVFGRMLLNVRVLNLNFNALQDLSPLYGILRLKKLHLVGNRLERFRQNISGLARFREISLIDIRNNPLDVGFYSPNLDKAVSIAIDGDEPNGSEPFVLGAANAERDKKYSACLDMPTRMMRRVYEMLILAGCPRLKILDGLHVDRSLLAEKDIVYEAMLETGIMADDISEEDKVDEKFNTANVERERVEEVVVDPILTQSAKQPLLGSECGRPGGEQPPEGSDYVREPMVKSEDTHTPVIPRVSLTCVYDGDTWPLEDSFA